MSIAIGEVTYKPGTNIIEQSQQLLFAAGLANRGYDVVIRESIEVIEQVKEVYAGLFRYESEMRDLAQ